jgi:hypothetical protein
LGGVAEDVAFVAFGVDEEGDFGEVPEREGVGREIPDLWAY